MNRIIGNITKANKEGMGKDAKFRGKNLKLFMEDIDQIGVEQLSMFDEEGNINEYMEGLQQEDEDRNDPDDEGIVLDEEVSEE